MYDRSEFYKWIRRLGISKADAFRYLADMDHFFNDYKKFGTGTVLMYKECTAGAQTEALAAYSLFSASSGNTRGEAIVTAKEYKQLCTLLWAYNNPNGYFRIRCLACTGAMALEFSKLKKAHLKTGIAEIEVSGRIRAVYIPDRFIQASAGHFDQLDDRDFLFPAHVKAGFKPFHDGAPISRDGVNMYLKQLADRYGIRREVMHAHAFRMFYMRYFLKAGGSITALADILAHPKMNLQGAYSGLTKEELLTEVNRYVTW